MYPSVLAVTPLKIDSTRLPGKNFLTLGKKPLYRWAMDSVGSLLGDVIDGIYVYGSDEVHRRIQDDCSDASWFDRLGWLAEESVPAGQDGNQLFAKMIYDLPPRDFVLIFNCTAPFVRPETYRKAVLAIRNGEGDSAASAVKIRGRIWSGTHPINHQPNTCPMTQRQAPLCLESEAFWVVRPQLVFFDHRRIGFRPVWIPVTGIEAVDINTVEDFAFAESLAGSVPWQTIP